MIWILFVILVNGEQYMVKPDSVHPSMDSCFDRRDQIVAEVGNQSSIIKLSASRLTKEHYDRLSRN